MAGSKKNTQSKVNCFGLGQQTFERRIGLTVIGYTTRLSARNYQIVFTGKKDVITIKS